MLAWSNSDASEFVFPTACRVCTVRVKPHEYHSILCSPVKHLDVSRLRCRGDFDLHLGVGLLATRFHPARLEGKQSKAKQSGQSKLGCPAPSL